MSDGTLQVNTNTPSAPVVVTGGTLGGGGTVGGITITNGAVDPV